MRSRGSSFSSPCRREQQQDRSRIQQHRDDQDEPAQDILVAGAEQCCQIAHRTQVGLCHPPIAVDLGLLDLQVGEDLRLDRKLVGKAVALGVPSFVVCSAELGAALIAILFSKTIGTTRRPPLDCC